MASTYSNSLRLELIGTGEQDGTWGTTTNTNLGTLIEQAITGVAAITMTTGDYTLSTNNGASDEARNAVLELSGTIGAARNLIVPAKVKAYRVYNGTADGYNVTVKTSSGTGIVVPNGHETFVYCDGTNVVQKPLSWSTTNSEDGLYMTSTESGSAAGPVMTTYRNSSSPANGDFVGALNFYGNSSAGAKSLYGRIVASAKTVTAGSQESLMRLELFSRDLLLSETGSAASLLPDSNNSWTLGASSLGWADIYMASGGLFYEGSTGYDLFGFMQRTWTDVTGSRSEATSYVNANSYPIEVAISANPVTSNLTTAIFQTSPDNSTWTNVYVGRNTSDSVYHISAPIPIGHYYRMPLAASVLSIRSWSELS